jgi:hypothetical protein
MRICGINAIIWTVVFSALLLLLLIAYAYAHDHTRPDLNNWFAGLHAGSGALCCDGTDIDTGKAKHVATEDWDVKDEHYRVRLDGHWIDVPENAVIHQPNLYGETLVWPVYGYGGSVWIRCFLPGAGI